MGQKKNQVTILFIPDDTGRTVSVHVHRGIIQALIIFAVLIVAGMAGLLYVAGDIAVKLQQVYLLKKENQRLRDDNSRLLQISAKLDNVQRMHEYLSRLMRMTGEQPVDVPGKHGRADESTVTRTDTMAGDGAVSPSPVVEALQDRKGTPHELFDGLPYLRPVEGWVTREFMQDSAHADMRHEGVDFAAVQGTPIRVTAPGTVKDAGTDEYFGKNVTVEHRFGFVTRYGHCSHILVSAGDHVKRGQIIALVGNTGRSSAPHLHYEVIKDNHTMDPFRYILSRQQ